MPRMTPEKLEAYLAKLKEAGVRSFEGLGINVVFGESGGLQDLEAEMTAEEIDEVRERIAMRKTREALELENWSSDD